MDEILEPMDVDDEEADQTRALNNQRPPPSETRYENRAGTFTTGIDIFSKEEELKMKERAKRFGLQEKLKKSNIGQDKDLYSSMGIAKEDENTKNLRLNVLHVRGTEDMSTNDVFTYFVDYAPAFIEWINDVSCNVAWHDNISAARALLGLSKKIVGLGEKVAADRHIKSEASSFDNDNNLANDDCIIQVVRGDGSTGEATLDNNVSLEDDNNTISLKDIQCPLPPGLWRKGIDCPKSKSILLRFATRNDKKHPNAEKMSDYYKKYGNPNFGGIKGLLTESRKRMYKQDRKTKKRDVDSSDQEESEKKRTKNPWGVLSETWGQNDSVEDSFRRVDLNTEQKTSVKERLGFKTQSHPKETSPAVVSVPETVGLVSTSNESGSNSSHSSDDDEWCKKSKVPRMRMHADDEEEKVLKKRIKQRTQEFYTNTSHTGSNDLRSRLGGGSGGISKRKPVDYRDAIQIIVTNSPENFRLPRAHIHEKEEDDEIVELNEEEDHRHVQIETEDEPEEGEWTEEGEQLQTHDHLVDEKEEEDEKSEEGEDSDDSDVSEKEIQGPKGSVIKVVPRVKPRVASTVWARLNNTKTTDTESSKNRASSHRDLRDTLKGNLRLRLGYQNRGRSPLRIEVKNDKYAEESSGTE